MTTVGIMSDTHGNHAMMQRAADAMKKLGCMQVFHLGDTYRDSRDLLGEGMAVIAVPGNWDPEFTDSGIANARCDTVDGIRFGLVHDPFQLPGHIKAASDIMLTGHSHEASVYKEERIIHLNPGHLKSPQDKGCPPGFATVGINGGTVTCRLYGVNGTLKEEQSYVLCKG